MKELITSKDKEILQELVKEIADIAALPVQKEKARMWNDLNSLKPERPMVWLNEVPWHEMDVNAELHLRSTGEFARSLEWDWRRLLYQWKHMRADMVVHPVIFSPLEITNTGFGITEDVDVAKTDENNDIISRHFNVQIKSLEDIEKIKDPVVALDKETTERKFEALSDVCEGIIPVEKRGMPGFWFAPWDELIRWMGVEDALMALCLNPELVHAAMDRLVNAYLVMLDQYEEQNLLAVNNLNDRVGSGGYGYTTELPQKDFNKDCIRTQDLWGCGTAQIFSAVSPEMHDEFALQYELKWMRRFGLNYYGCCEPLHRKMDLMRKIPNLRKISMSRWINVDEAVEAMENHYVFSYKPNPAIFATDYWDKNAAREDLEKVLEKTSKHGCSVEIIMKDISTVKYQPQRLWEWAEIAVEVAKKYAG